MHLEIFGASICEPLIPHTFVLQCILARRALLALSTLFTVILHP